MGDLTSLGNLAGGISQGFQQAQESAQKKELQDLLTKKAKLDLDLLFKTSQTKEEAQARLKTMFQGQQMEQTTPGMTEDPMYQGPPEPGAVEAITNMRMGQAEGTMTAMDAGYGVQGAQAMFPGVAEQKYRSASPGSTVFNEATGQPTFVAPAKPTDPGEIWGEGVLDEKLNKIKMTSNRGNTKYITPTSSGKLTLDVTGLQKSSLGKLEQDIFKSTAAMERLDKLVTKDFDPKWLTAAGQLDMWSLSKRERTKGMPVIGKMAELDKKDAAKLKKYSNWKTGVLDNINRHIHDLTGAQMSAYEIDRLMKSMPNMEMSLSEFMGARDAVMEQMRSATTRYKLFHKMGVDVTDKAQMDMYSEMIPLDSPLLQTIRPEAAVQGTIADAIATISGINPEHIQP